MEKSPNKITKDKKIYKLSPNLIIDNNNTLKYTSTSSRVFQTFSSIEKKEKNRNLSPYHQLEKELSEYNENLAKIKQKFNIKRRTKSKNHSKTDIKKSSTNGYKNDKQLIKDNSGSYIGNNNIKPLLIKNQYFETKQSENDKEKEIIKLKENNEELKDLVIRLKEALDNTNTIIPNILQQNSNDQNNLTDDEITRKNSKYDNESDLNEKILYLENEIINYNEKYNLYEEMKENLEKKNIEYLNIIDNLNHKNKLYVEEIDKLKEEKEQLDNNIKEKNKIIEKLNCIIDEIKKELEKEKNKNNENTINLNQDNTNLNNILQIKENEIEKLNNQIKEINEKNKKNISELEININNLEEEKNKIIIELNEEKKKIK